MRRVTNKKTNLKKNNLKKSPRLASYSSRQNNNNTMKKELVFPLVVGIILGAMVMIFWQFTAKLNNQNQRLAQLEQYTSQNAQTVNDVVNFINNSLGQQQEGIPTGDEVAQ